MAIIYATSLKSTRMQAVINAIDAGGSNGYMEICTAGYALVVSTIPLAKPSWIQSSGVITLAGIPVSDVDADATGTAAIARIKDSNGNIVVSGLVVGVGTGDIQLNSVSITQHQTVTITSGSITHS